jgi:SAM-dependent methyltransferase
VTWEETIQLIRNKPEYGELIKNAYLDENLVLNVERYISSEEYRETKRMITQYAPRAKTILDVGSGNGISSIAFALEGYSVTACEPDPSNTVGAGATRWLKDYYGIKELDVSQEYAEKISFPHGFFDVVFGRQVMHHAYDLDTFIQNLSAMIRPRGFLITIRDHVIYDKIDKEYFLNNHPLQKFYGGENAFTLKEYLSAMEKAGLRITRIIRHYDSVINYAPLTTDEFKKMKEDYEKLNQLELIKKIGFLGKIPFIMRIYTIKVRIKGHYVVKEEDIPGRMYSFIAQKK